jgi:PKD repeat protein
VTLSATDNNGGSGISSIHYTTNGTTPSLSSPTYTGAFTLNASATVRYRSWDVAGNTEATRSQTITVAKDSAPVARLTVSPTSGRVPLAVNADASTSTDTDAWPIASYAFSFGDGSGTTTQSTPKLAHTFTRTGIFTVQVTVRDTAGLSSSASRTVTVSR